MLKEKGGNVNKTKVARWWLRAVLGLMSVVFVGSFVTAIYPKIDLRPIMWGILATVAVVGFIRSLFWAAWNSEGTCL